MEEEKPIRFTKKQIAIWRQQVQQRRLELFHSPDDDDEGNWSNQYMRTLRRETSEKHYKRMRGVLDNMRLDHEIKEGES